MLSSICRRESCPFVHRDGPRRHGFCCNACRCGDPFHTSNCTGLGNQVVLTETRSYSQTHVNPQVSGSNQERMSTGSSANTSNHAQVAHTNLKGFFLPRTWLRESATISYHVHWYMRRYNVSYDDDAEHLWHDFTCYIQSQSILANRSIRLYAFAQDRTPVCFQDRNVDVTQSGLTAHSAWYDMSTITGIDFMVQAVIVKQPACIEALHDAVMQIETHNHNEFAFVCHGATHRSVACCILLAQLVYPYAQVCLSTRRTQQAAAEYNLY